MKIFSPNPAQILPPVRVTIDTPTGLQTLTIIPARKVIWPAK